MAPTQKALILVALFVISTMHLPVQPEENEKFTDNIFHGFTTSTDIWNETPFESVAVPDGFSGTTTADYSDVAQSFPLHL